MKGIKASGKGAGRMKTLRRVCALLLCAAALSGVCSGVQAPAAQAGFTIGLYAAAGLEGRYYDTDPLTGEAVDNGCLQLSAAMAQERETVDGAVLINTGDILGDPLLLPADPESWQTDPAVVSMRAMGCDVLIPGERETQLSEQAQAALFDALQNEPDPHRGGRVAVLRADAENAPPYYVRSFSCGETRLHVGVLNLEALTGEDACARAQLLSERLRSEQGCCVVAAVACPVMAEKLAAGSCGIDIFFTSQAGAPTVRTLRNTEGERVKVVRCGTGVLAKAEVTLRSDGSVSSLTGKLLDLSGYEADESMRALLRPGCERMVRQAQRALVRLSGNWDREYAPGLVQSDTMDLLHEAQLWTALTRGGIEAQVSIASPQMRQGFSVGAAARQAGEENACLSLRECRRLYEKGDYPLYLVRMTGLELKQWLEAALNNYTVQGGAVIHNGEADELYGVSWEAYLDSPPGQRVVSMSCQGEPVMETSVFTVAVSSRHFALREDRCGWQGMALPASRVIWSSLEDERFGPLGGGMSFLLAEYLKEQGDEGALEPVQRRSLWHVYAGDGAQATAPVTRLEFVTRLVQAREVDASRAPAAPFSDVADIPAVNWTYEKGITRGNGSGSFLPEEIITREQALVMFLRFDEALGRGPKGQWAVAVPYSDAVDSNVWAADALMWNVLRGYLTPTAENALRLQEALTAGELDAALARMDKSAGSF